MRDAVLAGFAAVLGAVIGSFLNACIYRLPRGISLRDPRRSFCPACGKKIPWYENLPLVSWLWLGGRCSGCRGRISVRYPLVEALTALLFLAAWSLHGLPLAPVYWVLLSLLVAATFVDIEHFIIPDTITWGGVAAGVVLSAAVPSMMGTASPVAAGLLSLGGAALGFGLLWMIVEGGKLAFGKKRHRFKEAETFEWRRDGDRADLLVGSENLRWEEIFSRESDELILECGGLAVDGGPPAPSPCRAVFRYDRLILGGSETPLDSIAVIRGTLREMVIPREAMGFGDVKFLAAIGAFLGWQAVLFVLFVSSVVGSVFGLAGILIARDRAGVRVPFGPFLALGAAVWIFGGSRFLTWYLHSLGAGARF
jgi:leader peptidase (prepilin peptidase) / N-methyltransferase